MTGVDMRAYRAANPDYAERGRKQTQARWRALMELSRRHADEFARLYDAELRRVGVELRRPGRTKRARP
jgi:hypothetical protein